jgi:hypothetical protein
MNTNQAQYPNHESRIKIAAALAAFICQMLAVSVEVFLHTGFGRRYFGIPSLAALLLIPLFSIFWPGGNLDTLWIFWWAYLIALFIARFDTLRRWRLGEFGHSYYSGRPRCMAIFKRASEKWIKEFFEPMLVFFSGVLALPYGEPLGSYLMIAGIGLAAMGAMREETARARVMDMNDAMIDQNYIFDRFRGRVR